MDNNIYNIQVGDQIKIISVFDVIEVTSEGMQLSISNKPQTLKSWKYTNDMIKKGNYEIIKKTKDMLTELPKKWYFEVTSLNVDEVIKLRGYCYPYGCITSNSLNSRGWGIWYPSPSSGYERISFEDFKRLVLKEDKMEILKDDQEIVVNGIKAKVYNRAGWLYLTSNEPGIDQSELLPAMGIQSSDKAEFTRKVLGYYESGGFPECKTLEDLTKLVQAIKDYKMNKKIIGYKAPMDYYTGNIKKGEILKDLNGQTTPNGTVTFKKKEYGIIRDNSTFFIVPPELVETWEPVYEVQKLNKVGEHDVTYNPGVSAKVGCTTYTKQQLTWAKEMLETKNVEYIGCTGGIKITLDIINQLIQGLES